MRTALRILATRLWWRHAFQMSGATTHAEFVRKFDCYASPKTGYGMDPRLLRAWEAGKRYVSRGIVHRVESRVPRTRYVFALVALLDSRRISAPAAGRLMENYFFTGPDGSRIWRLPSGKQDAVANKGPDSIAWDDSATLATRGDFLGLLAILVLLRQSMAHAELKCVRKHAKCLYAALPTVSRIEWVLPDIDLLLQCIEQMHGIYWLPAHFEIDWKIFRAQILNPKPWVGRPPWILDADAGLFGGDWHRCPARPVPLLETVEPLWPYILDAKTLAIEQTPRTRCFNWAWVRRQGQP